VGTLLAVETGHEERGVVLVAEELERRHVLERVDVVLLGEVDGMRALESVLGC
jgi:hypothetical protein